jgi:dolichyl-phosphate beta-glucosyltransferase
MMLSIVLPAYNEAQRISLSIEEIRTKMPSVCTAIAEILQCDRVAIAFEVIVVNDGSSDRTGEIVRKYIERFPDFDLQLIDLPTNQGKGYAVKIGVEAARGKYIVFMDTDLSTPLSELPKLIQALQKNKAIAIGSRGLAKSQIVMHQPIYRELMGKIFNLLVKLFVINGIHDTQCGFKGFRAYEAKQIFGLLQTHRFGFDVELLLIAQELGISIQEIPVTWCNYIHSSVSPLRDSWEMFYSLLQMKRQVRQSLLIAPIEEKIILHGQ